MNYFDYISINANIRFGKPCITGTRISVYDVQSWLSEGMTFSDIIEDFPELNEEKINACLAYEKEHKHNSN